MMDAETLDERVTPLYNSPIDYSEIRPDASQEVLEMKHTANQKKQKYTALYYNGPPVKTTLSNFIVNQIFPILTLAASRATPHI